MQYIVSIVEDREIEAYKALCKSLRVRRNSKTTRIVALVGDLSSKAKQRLSGIVDDMACVEDFDTLRQIKSAFGSKHPHSIIKIGTLLFVKEYLEKNAIHRDTVCALNPSSLFQCSPSELTSLIVHGKVMFSRAIRSSHTAHNPNVKLRVAEQFDKPGWWLSTGFVELNIGICVAEVFAFSRLVEVFARFLFDSKYFDICQRIPEDLLWDCQDFFSYFYRKT